MDTSDLLMLSGVAAACAECGAERIFVPIDPGGAGEHCCTTCDAAVFLSPLLEAAPPTNSTRVA